METTKFHSELTNCILIPRFSAIAHPAPGSDDLSVSAAEAMFYFPHGEHDGLCEVHLNGYLVCALEKCDIIEVSRSIPEFMRVSLFQVLKYWFKAWMNKS